MTTDYCTGTPAFALFYFEVMLMKPLQLEILIEITNTNGNLSG